MNGAGPTCAQAAQLAERLIMGELEEPRVISL